MQSESFTETPTQADSSHRARYQAARAAQPDRRKKRERVFAVVTIVLIIAAWMIGFNRENGDMEPYLHQAMPEAERLEKTRSGSYAAYSSEQVIGYIVVGEGNGYGGPMNLAVATDLQGRIVGLAVVRHRETPSWFKRVQENGFFSGLIGKSFRDPFTLGRDIDAVSGATYTSRGIADAALRGSRLVAEKNLNFSVPAQAPPKIVFGLPEIVLLALFALGFIGHRKSFRYKKKLRWFCMLTGMFSLGFIYTNPLTISLINKMLLGFWPDWHTHLYWYLLLGGILFTLTASGKNPYCEWFCPFGAAQECMGKIGGAKPYAISRYRSLLKWLQRGLALAAILVALMYRNPGISSYEIFGTLFDLKGNIPQFFLLALVILASLFVHRPWCRYLCPLKPLEAFIRFLKTWLKNIWPNKNTVTVTVTPKNN
ncbi:FMN-binding protein [Desulfosediminicola ganghwensis]|uniref:FMN-binding protein n=1 Tax=Desulfosediminicola ganghwensis TaxID=2569540 RepID=UPI0010ABEF8E|nr:FMN-binding protein [Desulfosediminicola ganghwensis]